MADISTLTLGEIAELEEEEARAVDALIAENRDLTEQKDAIREKQKAVTQKLNDALRRLAVAREAKRIVEGRPLTIAKTR